MHPNLVHVYPEQPTVAVRLAPPPALPAVIGGAVQQIGLPSVTITHEGVRDLIDKNLISGVQDRLGFLANQLAAGHIDVDQWYERSAGLVRAAHSAAALAAAGGMKNFTQDHRDELDRRIQEQLAYLQRFADQLRIGSQPLNGFVPVRARMYADAAVGTYEAVRRRGHREAGYRLERRILDPAAEHCIQCISYAAKGWQPINSLPGIGQSPCANRCRCSFEYLADDEAPPPEEPLYVEPKAVVPPAPAASRRLPLFLPSAYLWTLRAGRWRHLDGTEVRPTEAGMAVFDRLGKKIVEFPTLMQAVRFVESGGKSLELATAKRGDVKPEKQPSSAPADHVQHVHDAVKTHSGPHNLASMIHVRKHLVEQGVTDRAEQDAAIYAARRAGKVGASGLEGRHGATAEEREAALPGEDGGHALGYLSLKGED